MTIEHNTPNHHTTQENTMTTEHDTTTTPIPDNAQVLFELRRVIQHIAEDRWTLNRMGLGIIHHRSDTTSRDNMISDQLLRLEVGQREFDALRAYARRANNPFGKDVDAMFDTPPTLLSVSANFLTVGDVIVMSVTAGAYTTMRVDTLDVITGERSVRVHGTMFVDGEPIGPAPTGARYHVGEMVKVVR